MEVPAGVNVSVDARRQSAIAINAAAGQPASFEEVMDKVTAKLLAERNAAAIETTTASGSQSTDNETDD